MELDKNKQYLVYNYNGSPVAIATRNDSFIISGGTQESPGSLPLTLDEIMQVNNNCNVFKYGLLWFEKEYEDAIYDYLRIKNYKEILTDDEIRDILVHPTSEGLKKILSITNDTYFNRVRGIHIGLKNSTDISSRIDRMIDTRYKEIMNKKATTSIIISTDISKEETSCESDERVKALENKIEQLTDFIMKLTGQNPDASKEPVDDSNADSKQDKPKTRKSKVSETSKE